MEYSFTNENRINGNNETIEMFTNDVILEEKYEEMKMCKQKQVGIHKMLLKN
jgi:non-ribosomal peptide synthetase component F